MDTPLNKAHFYARRAMQMDNLEQKIEYIQKTIENFNLAQTTNPKALESIQLQKEFYEKQLELLNHKRNFRDQRITAKQQQQKTDDDDNNAPSIDINEHVINTTAIQLDLFKNLESYNKMLEELKRFIPDNANFNMNEFQKLNSQFNDLFEQLIKYADETVSENEQLKERLRAVEETKQDITAISVTITETVIKEKDIQRDSDSSPEEMQDLPPLELPDFNLDSLSK